MATEKDSAFDINALFYRAKNGDIKAENALLKQLDESFRLIVQRRIWNDIDSEDIMQEAMVTILKKYKDLEIKTSFGAWAYRVLNNKMMDYVQKKTIRKKLDEQRIKDAEPVPAAPDPDLKEQIISCFKKISGTNLRHARILNLHYQGYTVEEICEKMSIKRNNAYVLLNRARTALELCLEKGRLDNE